MLDTPPKTHFNYYAIQPKSSLIEQNFKISNKNGKNDGKPNKIVEFLQKIEKKCSVYNESDCQIDFGRISRRFRLKT